MNVVNLLPFLNAAWSAWRRRRTLREIGTSDTVRGGRLHRTCYQGTRWRSTKFVSCHHRSVADWSSSGLSCKKQLTLLLKNRPNIRAMNLGNARVYPIYIKLSNEYTQIHKQCNIEYIYAKHTTSKEKCTYRKKSPPSTAGFWMNMTVVPSAIPTQLRSRCFS